MNLPEKIPMVAVLFADLAKGGYIHQHRNNEFGINRVASANERNDRTLITWTIDSIPDETFNTFEEVRIAVSKKELNNEPTS